MKNSNMVNVAAFVTTFTLCFTGAVTAIAQVNLSAQTPPLITITNVPHPLALPGPGVVTYSYTVVNEGTVPLSDVTVVDNKCSSVSLISGDANSNSKLEEGEIWNYRCVTDVSQTTASTAAATGRAGGFVAVDTANASVFIGVPLPPPLIHLEKKPSASVLPAEGGFVTFTYLITNPGPAPLSNVTLTDDRCVGLPGHFVGSTGDLNQNNLLESNETWMATCQMNIMQTTNSIGRVEGSANGLNAFDSSLVTVAVSLPGLPETGAVPGLPNTGLPPETNVSWSVIIPAEILVILLSLFLGRKKIYNLIK